MMADVARGTRNRTAGGMSWAALAVLALIVAPALASAGNSPVDVQVLESGDRIVLEYSFGDYRSHAVTIDGQEFTNLQLESEAMTQEVGAPALPKVARSVIIPDDAGMSVRVMSAEYYEVPALIAPSKGSLSRAIDPATVPYTFGDAYSADAFYPGSLAELGDPYVLRDWRGICVTVYPFQYNAATGALRVYTNMTVEVVATGSAAVNALAAAPRPRALSRAFHEVYSSHFVNYDCGFAPRYSPLDEDGDMLIIVYDSWNTNIQPLAAHKNSIGIDTTVVSISTIGNTASAIQSYIQSFYNSSDLAFVLLVGDRTQVQSPTTAGGSGDTGPGDGVYAKVAGGDNYPDIMIGRFSANSASEVDTQVQRTIEYETMPAVEQTWFWKGTGIGSSQGAGIGDEGQADYVHIGEIRTWLLNAGYTEVDGIYDPGATAAQVTTALNAGRGILNYCGHGSEYAISTTGFSTTNLNALVNDNMLPFMFLVACQSGSFEVSNCFGEVALVATDNGEPTGAIACYASSTNHPWAEPMEAQDEFNLLLTDAGEPYHTIGALCYAGSCSMIDDYPSVGAATFNTWILFGDPSLRVVGTVAPPTGLAVTPATGLVSEGAHGGPFTPSSADYTLENQDDTSMLYEVTKTQSWVSLTNASGTIPAHGSVVVTVSINSAANGLANGGYSDTVSFVNLSTHEGDTTRDVSLNVGVPTVQYDWPLDSDPGWSTTGQWAFGTPTGGGGSAHGDPDPTSGATGSYVYGVNLSGDYSTTTGGPYYVTLGPVDLSDITETSLTFQRWLNTDYDPYVDASIEVSNNGSSWTEVWSNGNVSMEATSWTSLEYDISATADNQATVYVRWSYEIGSGAYAYSGWNIDDVEIWGLGEGQSYVPGDLNCDGVLNNFDIDPFVLVLTGTAGYPEYYALYPACDHMLADCNDDGSISNFDIDAFVDLLNG